MKFMVMIRATEDMENGVMPSAQALTEMTDFNEKLVKAGIMIGGDGLHPSSNGARVTFDGTKTTVIDGPFAEAKELIAGYWIWEVGSLQEAIEWVKQVPNTDGGHGEIEIRQIFEAEDFGDEFTPEARAKDAALRARAGE
ncbi:YciI family protein [Kibdelosporangium philippinense]|uniref:YciI family protein n=1 Tax=Kibdelosporangium philippinense TaxID=211113 RepID=A0ABS8ZP86_9PSEU|nr:YciI family protein [Kibdelosporangium philippinense]MCE7009574.1 YciI family protein [Kibdelosporangium philippinense]